MLKAVKHLIIGGGAIDKTLETELQNFPNAVWSTYGMTETLSHIAMRRISGSDADCWYTPFDGVNVSLDTDGCLVIDAPAVCPSVLHTNDIAELHADGRRFRILGRKDNVICSGGIKIMMEGVEDALRPHLSVPFTITKRVDTRLGEAVVILFEGTDAMIDTVKEVCLRVLPKYWRPKNYTPINQIPITETGKPARAEAQRIANEAHAGSCM